MGLAPRLGEALGVESRAVELEVGVRRLRGRMVVDELADEPGTRPDEGEVRCVAGFIGGSGMVT